MQIFGRSQYLFLLKVSKSQNQFFLKLHSKKKERTKYQTKFCPSFIGYLILRYLIADKQKKLRHIFEKSSFSVSSKMVQFNIESFCIFMDKVNFTMFLKAEKSIWKIRFYIFNHKHKVESSVNKVDFLTAQFSLQILYTSKPLYFSLTQQINILSHASVIKYRTLE